jgi:serine/threonine protein kinase
MNPAEQLKGLELPNGWKVIEPAKRKPNATGGFFSQGYIAEHCDGRRGFLKAMDYTKAFASANTAETLQAMTNAYVFEKALCGKCSHLSRIARAIDDGSILINPEMPYTKVEYLIFELADGDIRAHLDMQATLDIVFVMRTLHNVATGLSQLHRADIAHQDLKPSNVLVFKGSDGSKICDLGRGWDRSSPGPHDALSVAGDRSYAPLDLMYGEMSADHCTRRFGCDVYHLGSLIVFFFSRVHVNALVMDNLDIGHRAPFWGGSYREVLPFVQAAFELALLRFAESVPDYLKSDLRGIVAELCNPDPNRRGHPQNRGGNQFGLERYISAFDRLAHKAHLEFARSGA